MTGDARFALDTSFVIDVLKGIAECAYDFREIAIPFAVVGELRFGAMGGRDPVRRLAEVDDLVSSAVVLSADQETARTYSEIRFALKRKGTPIPENDIWIAATAIQHRLTLISRDRHFDVIHGLVRATG